MIPGHGRLCEQMEVVDYRDMVVVVRDVVEDMIKQGMTLDQIKAASPAKPYETQYGTRPGATDAFIEAIYKGLTASRNRKHATIHRDSFGLDDSHGAAAPGASARGTASAAGATAGRRPDPKQRRPSI